MHQQGIFAAVALALASTAFAKTDIGGCTTTTIGGHITYYVPGTYEVCEILDCGGGRAPPKTNVPGCAAYSGTETYSPHYLTLSSATTPSSTALSISASATTSASSSSASGGPATTSSASPASTLTSIVSSATGTAVLPTGSSNGTLSGNTTLTPSPSTTGVPGAAGALAFNMQAVGLVAVFAAAAALL